MKFLKEFTEGVREGLGLLPEEDERLVLGEKVSELALFEKSDATIARILAWVYVPTAMLLKATEPKGAEKAEWEWVSVNGEARLDLLKEANPHINISGSSGYGKSTVAKILVKEISKTIPVLVLDVHDEYSSIVSEVNGKNLDVIEFSLGVWELDGDSVKQRVAENTAILKNVLELGDIQAALLARAAFRAYKNKGLTEKDTEGEKVPSVREVMREVNNMYYGSKIKEKSLLTLHRRLELLDLSDAFSSNTTLPLKELTEKTACLDLSGLRSQEAQRLYVEILLRKVYTQMLKQGKTFGVKLYVLVDEAQRTIPKDEKQESYLAILSAESRKYGIGLITASQELTKMDSRIPGNAGTTIAFYQKEPEEARYVSRILSGDSADYWKQSVIQERLNQLQPLECLLVNTTQRNPIQIKIEYPKTQEKPKEVKEKPLTEAIEEVLNERKLEYTKSSDPKQPNYTVIKNGEKTAILIETEGKRIDRIIERIRNKAKTYQKIIVIVRMNEKEEILREVEEKNVMIVAKEEAIDYLLTV